MDISVFQTLWNFAMFSVVLYAVDGLGSVIGMPPIFELKPLLAMLFAMTVAIYNVGENIKSKKL